MKCPEFVETTMKEIELLRILLDLKAECYYCKENVKGKKFGIMPHKDFPKGIVVCNSPLCMCEWFEENDINKDKELKA